MAMWLLGGLHVKMARRWSMEEKAAITEQILTDHESAREEGL